MAKLGFNTLLEGCGMDIDKTVLIRYAFDSFGEARECYEQGWFEEFLTIPDTNNLHGYKYWAVFLGERPGLTRLWKCYEVEAVGYAEPQHMPQGYPHPESFDKGRKRYKLREMPFYDTLYGNLTIEWGNAPQNYYQKATNTNKPIALLPFAKNYPFPGYDSLNITYQKLEEVISNPGDYAEWKSELKGVCGVYLITDTAGGGQYIGSAYGKDGIWGRWADYVVTKHGNNNRLKAFLDIEPTAYKQFQFSILQVLPKGTLPDHVIQLENCFKDKLMTRKWGFNDN